MRLRGEQIAAVIVEPVLHTIGCIAPTEAFIIVIRSETLRSGTVLIFDEVVTGFRHALGGYQSICGVTPDLSTFGKANGYPIAVVAGRADIMNRFAPPGAM